MPLLAFLWTLARHPWKQYVHSPKRKPLPSAFLRSLRGIRSQTKQADVEQVLVHALASRKHRCAFL